jgi:hypothetical protein
MLLLLLSEVNNTTILLMASINAINGKNISSTYTATLLYLLLAIEKGLHGLLLWPGTIDVILHHGSSERQNYLMALSQQWPIAAWLQLTAPREQWYVVVVLCN